MKLKSKEVVELAKEANLVFNGPPLPHHRAALMRFAALILMNQESIIKQPAVINEVDCVAANT